MLQQVKLNGFVEGCFCRSFMHVNEYKSVHGQKQICKAMAQRLEFQTALSLLWDVPFFDFFWGHMNCRLHLEGAGLLPRWIAYMGAKYIKQVCKQINEDLA